MGWFSDFAGGFFTPEGLMERAEFLAPLAAGAAMGPAGFAGATAAFGAGAATGAGIAAIKGEDVLTGGLTGGLSGMTGGSLNAAFNPGALSSTAPSTVSSAYATPTGTLAKAPAFPISPPVAGGNVGSGAAMFEGLAAGSPKEALGLNYGAAFDGAPTQSVFANQSVGAGLKQGLSNFGGGSSLVGAGKLASTGLGLAGMAGLDQTPMTMEEDDRGKYDPNATLNLGGGKPLDLSGDSGLRLIASGGYIGKRNYADGGYLEGGPAEGDGMSDDIPATIDETQPAALSEGEFVIPADVVAFAGNGSSDAGARRFYEMMEQIRRDATGRPEQIREIELEDYMPYSSESR